MSPKQNDLQAQALPWNANRGCMPGSAWHLCVASAQPGECVVQQVQRRGASMPAGTSTSSRMTMPDASIPSSSSAALPSCRLSSTQRRCQRYLTPGLVRKHGTCDKGQHCPRQLVTTLQTHPVAGRARAAPLHPAVFRLRAAAADTSRCGRPRPRQSRCAVRAVVKMGTRPSVPPCRGAHAEGGWQRA